MLTPRQYEQLGREVFHRNPEYAREIIGEVGILPDIKDLRKLGEIFKRFCEINNIPTWLLSQKTKKARNFKKLFLMIIVLCFHADARNQEIRIRHGLYSATAKVIGGSISITRKHANTARAEYHIYKDFKKEVDSLYAKIIREYAA